MTSSGTPRIAIVVAMDERGLIGNGNALPWALPADLRRFKAVTMGHPLIMGRRTHESIGRPLPGRRNIVVSRDPGYTASGCETASSLVQAVRHAGDVEQVMVVGGRALYAEALPIADRLLLTEVHGVFEGDVFFPEFDRHAWREVGRERHENDEHNAVDYSYVTLVRR